MKSRLGIAMGAFLLVAAANATSILGPGGGPLTSYSTGANQNVATVATGATYFDAGTPTTGSDTHADSYWQFKYDYTDPNPPNNILSIGTNALVTTDLGSGWTANDANSSWIGFCNCNATDIYNNNSAAPQAVEFSLAFSSVGVNTSLASIVLDWEVAPASIVQAIHVNGQLVTGTNSTLNSITATNYNTFHTLTITDLNCNNCFDGTTNNTIVFSILPASSDPQGLRVHFISADDGTPTGPAVPEPGSIVLALTGVAGLVAGVRRKKRS